MSKSDRQCIAFCSLDCSGLCAGSPVGSFGHAHAVLRLGFAALAGLRGGDTILILLRHRGIARTEFLG